MAKLVKNYTTAVGICITLNPVCSGNIPTEITLTTNFVCLPKTAMPAVATKIFFKTQKFPIFSPNFSSRQTVDRITAVLITTGLNVYDYAMAAVHTGCPEELERFY